MSQAKRELERQQQEEADKQAAEDHVAREKEFVCVRCDEPLPKESWGVDDLCSYCQQVKDNMD